MGLRAPHLRKGRDPWPDYFCNIGDATRKNFVIFVAKNCDNDDTLSKNFVILPSYVATVSKIGGVKGASLKVIRNSFYCGSINFGLHLDPQTICMFNPLSSLGFSQQQASPEAKLKKLLQHLFKKRKEELDGPEASLNSDTHTHTHRGRKRMRAERIYVGLLIKVGTLDPDTPTHFNAKTCKEVEHINKTLNSQKLHWSWPGTHLV